MVDIVKALYENFECRVIHNNQLTEAFEIKTGVKQGCILSPILFSLAIDWIMKSILGNRRTGIQWTLNSMLEDLDYADDIGLLSNRHRDLQEKTEELSSTASFIGLKVNERKTQIFRKNATITDPIKINGNPLEDVDEFVYLSSKINTDGDCMTEVTTRISKAGQAFSMLRNIWKSSYLYILKLWN